MSLVYTTGLNNMGPYQVSGRPWLKNIASLADGNVQFLEFPKVTKKVRVKNHSTSGNCLFGFCTNPGSGINFGATTGSHIANTFTALTSFTLSFWIDFSELGTGSGNRKRILELNSAAFGFNNGFAVHVHKNSDTEIEVRLYIDNAYGSAVTVTVDTVNKWHHIAVSGVAGGSGENKIYINGALGKTATGDFGDIQGMQIGDNASVAYLGGYDQMTLWNGALTDLEVMNLYNYRSNDPKDGISSGNLKITTGTLISWWAFESNLYKTFFTVPDTTSVIYDRVGPNDFALGSGTYTFVNGFNLDNVFAGGHVFKLQPLEQIEITCKTSAIVVKADGATQTFDVYASLTNVPSDRMYNLTGTGIDV